MLRAKECVVICGVIIDKVIKRVCMVMEVWMMMGYVEEGNKGLYVRSLRQV